MDFRDITVDTFIKSLIGGEKTFKNIAVEDYNFTLIDAKLDEVEFHESFVNINFVNCSFKRGKFISCNLKCISFKNCDLTECSISECSVESIVIQNCKTTGIAFGTNYAYGATMSPADCLSLITD